MRKYLSLVAGTHVVNFDFYPPKRLMMLNIEVDNSITVKDNLGLLSFDGSISPLPLDAVLELPVKEMIGISPLQFTVVTTVTTKVMISIEMEN